MCPRQEPEQINDARYGYDAGLNWDKALLSGAPRREGCPSRRGCSVLTCSTASVTGARRPYRFGADRVVKYSLLPAPGQASPLPAELAEDYLTWAMAQRLASHSVRFDFAVKFRNDGMPTHDAAPRWDETVSPFVTVATLTIPAQDFRTDSSRTAEGAVRICRVRAPAPSRDRELREEGGDLCGEASHVLTGTSSPHDRVSERYRLVEPGGPPCYGAIPGLRS